MFVCSIFKPPLPTGVCQFLSHGFMPPDPQGGPRSAPPMFNPKLRPWFDLVFKRNETRAALSSRKCVSFAISWSTRFLLSAFFLLQDGPGARLSYLSEQIRSEEWSFSPQAVRTADASPLRSEIKLLRLNISTCRPAGIHGGAADVIQRPRDKYGRSSLRFGFALHLRYISLNRTVTVFPEIHEPVRLRLLKLSLKSIQTHVTSLEEDVPAHNSLFFVSS